MKGTVGKVALRQDCGRTVCAVNFIVTESH